jgi:hypothetical protein
MKDKRIMTANRIESPIDALAYCVAGKATVTLRSTRTEMRFTYRIKQAANRETGKPEPLFFVKVLVGQDNESAYQYLGLIRHTPSGYRYDHGAKSKITKTAASAGAFEWSFKALARGVIPPELEVWHNGHCARCGRMLTVPESIQRGLGPKCLGRAIFAAEAA